MRRFKDLPRMDAPHDQPVNPKVGDTFWSWGCGHLRNKEMTVTRVTGSYFYFMPTDMLGGPPDLTFRARKGQHFPVHYVGLAKEHYALLYPNKMTWLVYRDKRAQEARDAFWAKRGRAPRASIDAPPEGLTGPEGPQDNV